MFLRDKNQGPISDELFKAIPPHFDRVDAGDLFEEISSVKSNAELESIEKAGKVVCFIMK
jgi:Xaa-Pro aminopeptidase